MWLNRQSQTILGYNVFGELSVIVYDMKEGWEKGSRRQMKA